MTIFEKAQAIAGELIGYRRAIHAVAETGFDLPHTRAFVKARLEEFGYNNIQEMGDGIVVTVGKGEKTFLLRADMDALPIKEDSGLEFASTNGKCHACGHDIHTTVLLGAAKLLKEMEAELPGTVKLMFQPAEEIFGGGKSMVAAGVLENPKVDAALAMHVSTGAPAGTMALRKEVYAASANNFAMKVFGKPTHGAMPERGVDPIYIASQIVIGLQEILCREVPFTRSAVLTIGHFAAGAVANAIPSEVLIEGTMRTMDPETQEYMKKRIPELAQDIARAYRGTVEFEYTCDTPVLVIDNDVFDSVCGTLKGMAPNVTVTYLKAPTTASEDFAEVASRVPSCFVSFGAANATGAQQFPVHHPKVLFDENAIPVGSAAMVECAINWLNNNK